MKFIPKLAAAFLAASVLTLSAFAADISGKWKWTTQGRNGPMEVTSTLALKDGALTGTVSGRMGDAPIGDASLKDGKVAFTVTREFDGNKIVIKYQVEFNPVGPSRVSVPKIVVRKSSLPHLVIK